MSMDGIILMCIAIEAYLVIVGIALVFETYYYNKDGNKKGTNLKGRILKKAIRHELIHARIANAFGFKDWKIIHKLDGLECNIKIDFDAMNRGYFFKCLRMWGVHCIFDIGGCIIWVKLGKSYKHLVVSFLSWIN